MNKEGRGGSGEGLSERTFRLDTTLVSWILAIGGGVLGIYLGVLAFRGSLTRVLLQIANGEIRSALSGPALGFIQSLRSAILYVALAWVMVMVISLTRRQMPGEAVKRGWIIALAVGIIV